MGLQNRVGLQGCSRNVDIISITRSIYCCNRHEYSFHQMVKWIYLNGETYTRYKHRYITVYLYITVITI